MNKYEPVWHTYSRARLLNLPEIVVKGLFANNSLTDTIMRACDREFSVAVIEQKTDRAFLSESTKLNTCSFAKANVRSVILRCKTTPVIFARTVLPLQYMKRSLLRLAMLGNRSLGSVLYSERTISKQQAEIAIFNRKHFLFDYIESHCAIALQQDVVGRRSIFELGKQKLLLNEIYLPAYWEEVQSTAPPAPSLSAPRRR